MIIIVIHNCDSKLLGKVKMDYPLQCYTDDGELITNLEEKETKFLLERNYSNQPIHALPDNDCVLFHKFIKQHLSEDGQVKAECLGKLYSSELDGKEVYYTIVAASNKAYTDDKLKHKNINDYSINSYLKFREIIYSIIKK